MTTSDLPLNPDVWAVNDAGTTVGVIHTLCRYCRQELSQTPLEHFWTDCPQCKGQGLPPRLRYLHGDVCDTCECEWECPACRGVGGTFTRKCQAYLDAQ